MLRLLASSPDISGPSAFIKRGTRGAEALAPALKRSWHQARASTQFASSQMPTAKQGVWQASSLTRKHIQGPQVLQGRKQDLRCPRNGVAPPVEAAHKDTFAVSSSKSEENNLQQQAGWVVLTPTLPAEIALAEKEHFTTFSCCTT